MNTCGVERLVYMRVEAEYSPVGRAGFQTVWRSAGLRTEEVVAIEERVQCFQPGDAARRRVQFFLLPGGLAAVTLTVTIEADREIVDRAGRAGAFCAHCLVLRRPQLTDFENNPFAVLDAAPWVVEPRRLVEAFGRAFDETPCQLLAPLPPPPLPARWQGEEVRRLVALGWSAATLRQERRTVLMTGASDEIEDALRVAFAFLPEARRLDCSFDTFVERCPGRPGDYWAAGGAIASRVATAMAVPGCGRPLAVDASAACVVETASNQGAAGSFFFGWLERSLAAEKPAKLLDRAPTIEALCTALTGEEAATPGRWEGQAVSELFVQFGEPIEQRVTTRAQRVLGPDLARRIAAWLLRRGAELEPKLLLPALSPARELDAVVFSRLAVTWLEDLRGERCGGLPELDLRPLRKLGAEARNWVLLHWGSTLGTHRDAGSRDLALARMSSEEFKMAMHLLCRPLAPADFVAERHLRTLVRDERLRTLGDADLVDLVFAALRIGQGGELSPLAELVPRLGDRDLALLARAAKGKKGADLAPEIRRAIDSTTAGGRRRSGWSWRTR